MQTVVQLEHERTISIRTYIIVVASELCSFLRLVGPPTILVLRSSHAVMAACAAHELTAVAAFEAGVLAQRDPEQMVQISAGIGFALNLFVGIDANTAVHTSDIHSINETFSTIDANTARNAVMVEKSASPATLLALQTETLDQARGLSRIEAPDSDRYHWRLL